jgi:hypothetical protein
MSFKNLYDNYAAKKFNLKKVDYFCERDKKNKNAIKSFIVCELH